MNYYLTLKDYGLMTAREVAEKIGVTVGTVHYWNYAGKFMTVEVTENGVSHYHQDQLEEAYKLAAISKKSRVGRGRGKQV